ncbi:glycoside hydrolase family 3 C-terminal domain-containing protein [Echinicola marina]|uniref:glycoside hydrolase family 3 N-terminal domain-containing protein n=1 Tax=Echinicola marina TaxID=2859768 RepID=UPI001CF637F1|nr:glycoside hydrolase family 3 N-terminal domain-containing protein [Echinicola marina]UCS92907.1 glycoside hydrolase family 3 C-terminal domain-containing protein [Echinicola marina]
MQIFNRLTLCSLCFSLTSLGALGQKANIYHKDWIDFNKNGQKDIFEDPNQYIERRVEDLLSQMTLEEKTCQTATLYGYKRVLADELPTKEWKNEIWKDGIANIDEQLNGLKETPYSYPFSKHAEAINTIQRWFIEETRLGIPVDFTNEAIHGLNHDHATPLPAPISIGSTWNKKLVRQAGSIAGREAKALGYTNIYAPILDLARDPRWGRVLECYGEEPFHVASMGQQMVEGIQSQGLGATLKHYAVYSVPKGGRDGYARTDPHVAPREMHQLHLFPYRKIIKESKPVGVMSSYNDWDGVPVSASYYFLTELLRHQFGFNGYVVSDSEAVEFVHSKHHVAVDYKDAVRQVAEAGLNVRTHFTPPQDYILPLRELVKEGRLSMETLDRNVADVLRVKFQLGLFDAPYVKDPKAADKIVAAPDTEDFVLNMARESLVLLKNEADLLPLKLNSLNNILVTGPLAEDESVYVSRYGPQNLENINIPEGIQQYVGDAAKVNYEKGCEVVDENWPESEIIPTPLSDREKDDIQKAVIKAQDADVVIAVLGQDEKRCGESKSRTGLGLPGRQLQLLQALKETGKPIVLVLINGQPLTINWENRYIPAILEAWFPNAKGGQAVAETLFGDYNPGGKLPVTFPKSLGQIELNFPFKPGSHAGQPGAGPNGYGNTAVIGPLYPFGYGLSYTSFSYANLNISPDKQYQQGQITVSADITNSGKMKGDEVVQLYIRDKVSSVTTYVSQLRGFERVTLEPGETKTVTFSIGPDDLEILDKNMNWTVEPGSFEVLLGSSSEDIRLQKEFEIIK